MKDEQSRRRAESLRKAIIAWCKSQGVDPPSRLGKILKGLGLSPGAWRSVFSGRAITTADNYAIVYLYTGIPEADPRTIPPLKMGGFSQGEHDRAWSESQWQSWLKTKAARNVLLVKEVSGDTLPIPEPVSEERTSNERFADILARLLDAHDLELIERTTRRILGEKMSVPQLVQAFLDQLQPVVYGSVEDRDKWYKENKSTVRDLAILLDILTQFRASREVALATYLRSKGS